MLSADFCMDPTNNILQMLESNSTTYQSTSYYLTCSGYNPLQYYISQANFYLDILNQSVTDLLQSYCKDNSYLKQVLVNISKSKSLLVSMQGLLNCSTIRDYYDSTIETGYCRDIFEGTYMFWLAFYVAGAALSFVPWFLWGFRHHQLNSGKVLPAEDDFDEINDNDEINDPLYSDDLTITNSMEELENVYRQNFEAYNSDIKKAMDQ